MNVTSIVIPYHLVSDIFSWVDSISLGIRAFPLDDFISFGIKTFPWADFIPTKILETDHVLYSKHTIRTEELGL